MKGRAEQVVDWGKYLIELAKEVREMPSNSLEVALEELKQAESEANQAAYERAGEDRDTCDIDEPLPF